MNELGRHGTRLAALALWGMVVLLVGALVGAGGSAGEEMNHAGLVITFEDGHTEKHCVEFAEEEISGVELLRRSGVTFVLSDYGGLGAAVCRIGDTGCTNPGDCFCQCRGAACKTWSYYALEDGEWRFQHVGASQRRVRDGDIDGWVWGPGHAPPEPVGPGEVCPLVAPTEPPPPLEPTEVVQPPEEEPTAGLGVATELPAIPSKPPASAQVERTATVAPSSGSDTSAGVTEAAPPSGVITPLTVEGGQEALVSEGAEEGAGNPAGAAVDSGGGGAPVGLIAFGVVAGLLVACVGGVMLRRRLSG